MVRFGQVLRSDDPPGLHFKSPFLDEAHYFDSRILTLDAEPQPFLTKEKKYVVVDSFVKWRMTHANWKLELRMNTLAFLLKPGITRMACLQWRSHTL